MYLFQDTYNAIETVVQGSNVTIATATVIMPEDDLEAVLLETARLSRSENKYNEIKSSRKFWLYQSIISATGQYVDSNVLIVFKSSYIIKPYNGICVSFKNNRLVLKLNVNAFILHFKF